ESADDWYTRAGGQVSADVKPMMDGDRQVMGEDTVGGAGGMDQIDGAGADQSTAGTADSAASDVVEAPATPLPLVFNSNHSIDDAGVLA
ncbi:MAG TPA: hypothetical protein VH475_29110, partial [Tepidisphaeraceae bacterium]